MFSKSHAFRNLKRLSTIILVLFLSCRSAPEKTYVRFVTTLGEFVVVLYDETPVHKEMFLKAIETEYKNGTEFNRVIESFVIQGGVHDDVTTARLAADPEYAKNLYLDPEIRDSLFHKKGVLGAGRDDNPGKRSFNNQFYIVQGRVWTDSSLNALEMNRMQGKKIPEWKREVYKTLGGSPHLDGNYTVFGEVVEGIEVIDAIAAVQTDSTDHPVKKIEVIFKKL
ncbi:MAG TPA: peptidylprolyl isomerase [Parasegetibacter sp.]